MGTRCLEDGGVCHASECQLHTCDIDCSPNDRTDGNVVKNGGLRKAFFVGGNSSCRSHIRQHYQLYQQRCKDANIPENHHAIPRQLWKEMNEEKTRKGKTQAKLDNMIKRAQGPREFTRESALHAITQFIACNDQVSSSENTD
jgi:hypothetical protein